MSQQQITFKNALTFCGNLGAGKTEVMKKIRKLSLDQLEIISVGNFFRQEAANRNISFAELQTLMISDSTIDVRIDTLQKEYLTANDNFIIDSRLGALFCREAFNVFLKVDEKIEGERIFKDFKNPHRKTEKVDTLEEVIVNNRKRVASEIQRYSTLYSGFNPMDTSNYDLVLDTTLLGEDEVAAIVFHSFKIWRNCVMQKVL